MPYERLEPCEGKLSRTVLRGGIGSDVNLLPDHEVFGSGGPDSGDHYTHKLITISETATRTALPLMAILPFPEISQCR